MDAENTRTAGRRRVKGKAVIKTQNPIATADMVVVGPSDDASDDDVVTAVPSLDRLSVGESELGA